VLPPGEDLHYWEEAWSVYYRIDYSRLDIKINGDGSIHRGLQGTTPEVVLYDGKDLCGNTGSNHHYRCVLKSNRDASEKIAWELFCGGDYNYLEGYNCLPYLYREMAKKGKITSNSGYDHWATEEKQLSILIRQFIGREYWINNPRMRKMLDELFFSDLQADDPEFTKKLSKIILSSRMEIGGNENETK
jgi:hypothetical protein